MEVPPYTQQKQKFKSITSHLYIFELSKILHMNAMCQFMCVRKIFEMQLLASSCLSVRPSTWKDSAFTGRVFFIKF